MSILRALPFVLAVAATPGCIIIFPGGGGEPIEPMPYPDDSGWACTAEAVASVTVSVVDFEGAPASGAMVMWSALEMDMGGEAECLDDSCTVYAAGWDVSSPIEIFASMERPTEDPACFWYAAASAVVEVPMDASGCHVETQSLTLELPLPEIICEDVAVEPEEEPVEVGEECDGDESDCG